jgi:hypothetical protein
LENRKYVFFIPQRRILADIAGSCAKIDFRYVPGDRDFAKLAARHGGIVFYEQKIDPPPYFVAQRIAQIF